MAGKGRACAATACGVRQEKWVTGRFHVGLEEYINARASITPISAKEVCFMRSVAMLAAGAGWWAGRVENIDMVRFKVFEAASMIC